MRGSRRTAKPDRSKAALAMEAPLAPLRALPSPLLRRQRGTMQGRCHSGAARLRRPQASIIHYDANGTVSESCCSRCSLALAGLAGVRRAGLAVLRGTEVVQRRLKEESEKSEAGEAAAGDLVYWTRKESGSRRLITLDYVLRKGAQSNW